MKLVFFPVRFRAVKLTLKQYYIFICYVHNAIKILCIY